MELAVLPSVQKKLDLFFYSKKIPHILFHGPSGSGKRTIVEQFLQKIYGNDRMKIKSNVMWVNCAHGSGRGIKFIREDLKFFAKSNIQFNCGVIFKTIVLLNADSLTTDAQSALRRCIELFSFNTRFFIIVENKNRLLNPILSRFCEIYIPQRTDAMGNSMNLHTYTIRHKYDLVEWNAKRMERLCAIMRGLPEKKDHKDLVELATQLYEEGYSCLDWIAWLKGRADEKTTSAVVLCFHKIKAEFRCEKLMMLYLFDYAFLRPNKDLKNVGFM